MVEEPRVCNEGNDDCWRRLCDVCDMVLGRDMIKYRLLRGSRIRVSSFGQDVEIRERRQMRRVSRLGE